MIKELEPIANKLVEERGILTRMLDSLTDEIATRVMVTPEWSVKDALAHLVGAERGMLGIAKRMLKGEDPQLPPGYNNDEYNARQVAKRKALSLAELRAELEATRAELIALLESTTLKQLELCGQHPLEGEVSLKELLVIIYSHETTHCNEMNAKLRENKK